MEVSGERMEAQSDRPELADIAKEAKDTVVKRKRGRPQITGPQDTPPSPIITAAVVEWQQRQKRS
ncbi:hypothetical protein Q7I20_17900 [Aeromonas veronii]|uniref:hypothetical protein n=1 Tax=Aeromonas veronii TaxID=654 RepID=UPI0030049146